MEIILDAVKTKKRLKYLEKYQFPFVYAQTLTQLAVGGKQVVGMRARTEFDLHSNFIPNNIRVKPAKKSSIKNLGYAASEVFTGYKLDGWMGLHETGGTKKPQGSYLSIPGEDLKKKSYRKVRGGTKLRWKPAKVLQRKRSFIQTSKSGQKMILQRKSKKQYPLEVLYIFERTAKIKPEWDAALAVRKYVSFAFDKKFKRNMNKAMGV